MALVVVVVVSRYKSVTVRFGVHLGFMSLFFSLFFLRVAFQFPMSFRLVFVIILNTGISDTRPFDDEFIFIR